MNKEKTLVIIGFLIYFVLIIIDRFIMKISLPIYVIMAILSITCFIGALIIKEKKDVGNGNK